jgi:5'-3' exonuclease
MHLLIDLNNMAYRSLYSAKRNIDQVGYKYLKHVMFSSIIALCNKHKPKKVFLCVDHKQNWRKKIYPDYKGNRSKNRDAQEDIDWNEFFANFQQFTDECKKYFPFYVLQIKYMEADDIIGIMCKHYEHVPKVVVTTDNDFVQLLRYKNVKILDPIKGQYKTSDDPLRHLKIKCLMGDRGDNIPAIKPRVGEKGAEKLADNPELLKEMFEIPELGEEYKNNYKRNIKLIDMSRIPDVLYEKTIQTIQDYELPSPKNIFRYLTKNRFLDLVNRIQDIENICSELELTAEV